MKTLASRRLLCVSIGLASLVSPPSFAQAPFAPEIYAQPQSRTINPGASVTLSVDVNGFPSLQYRWWKNGQPFTSQTNTTTLVVPGVLSSAGSYYVVITNVYGAITSSVATLTVNTQAPGISSEPQSQVACAGGTAGFSATATFGLTNSGGGAYQWQFNGLDLPGRGGSSSNVFLTNAIRLILTNVTVADAGNYTLILSSAYGMVTSAIASLTVDPPLPIITQQPKSVATFVSNSVSFAVAAAACAPLTYQWRSNGVNLAGAITNRLSLFGVSEQAGLYDVVVTSAGNSATSHVAWLVASNFPPPLIPPTILTNPTSRTVSVGQAAGFFVAASGAPPPAYQWRKDGADLPDKTNSLLFITGVTTADAGDYNALVYNPAGAVTSAVATLTVTPGTPPTILTQPQSRTALLGNPTNAFLYVYATGTDPLSYQWFHNGQVLPGALGYNLLVSPLSTNAGDYFVVVSNGAGAVTSAVARLTFAPLIVNIFPKSSYVADGVVLFGSPRDVYFSGSVIGAKPLSVQWFHNGDVMPTAIDTNLVLGPITTNDAGLYWLVASNLFGAATSEVASITVSVTPPSIFQQPEGLTNASGSPLQLTVSARGALPMDFYWFHDGQPVPGVNSGGFVGFFYSAAASTNDTGSYFVIVSNFVGMATSAVVNVRVYDAPPTLVSQPRDWAVYTGGAAQFCVGTDSRLPLSYQWQLNGVDLLNATNACYSVPSASSASAGDYRVIVSNSSGSATSLVARLTVIRSLPALLTQPVSQGVGTGAGLGLFASSTNGTASVWQLNGQELAGQASASFGQFSLWFDDFQASEAGDYTIVITNSEGAVTSSVAVLSVTSGPLDHWQWRNPQPQGNDLYHAAYGDGRIVAVGSQGAKVVSTDGGTTWQAHNKSGADLGRVAYGNGLFVGVSPYGLSEQATWTGYRLQTSSNGVDWTERRIGLTNVDQLRDVAFGNGRFVVTANVGGVIFSTNGTDWEQSQWANSWTGGRVTFGNGLFLVTDGGGPSVSCAVSSDGMTWTNNNLVGGGYVFDLSFGNGQFAILGDTNYPFVPSRLVLSTSANGRNWTTVQIDSTNQLSHLAQGNGKFVALTIRPYMQGIIGASSDGVTWISHTVSSSNLLSGIDFCNDRFVAVGSLGTILTSQDGDTWQALNTNTAVNLRYMARGNGRYVAVGNEGVIFTSAEGSNWTRMTLATTSNLRGIAFGAGKFVAVGPYEGSLFTGSNAIFTSTDGLAWTRLRTEQAFTNTTFIPLDLYSIAYGAGTFVAVGENGNIVASTNGVNWIATYAGTSHRFNAVTYGGGQFVAVGKKGRIATSSTGLGWGWQSVASLLNSSTHFLQGVAYGNGIYVAAGQGGGLLVSSDALNWWAPTSPFITPSYTIDIEDVEFANGMFIAVGTAGLIATSTNGVFWTRHYSGCGNNLRGALYADCRFFAVGNNETILESDFSGPPMLRLAGAPGGGAFALSVSSDLNGSYRLQVSTNLRDWNDMTPITNALGNLTWPDTYPSSSPRRFYRAVSP